MSWYQGHRELGRHWGVILEKLHFWRGRNLRGLINFLLSMSFSKHSLKAFILEFRKEERLNSSSNFEENFELTCTLEFNSY